MNLNDPIIAALKKVYDPEMPINVYDLGLIYGIEADGAGRVAIRMTLTAPNCPVAGTLPAEVERAVRAVDGVTERQAGPGVRSAVGERPHVGSRQAGVGDRRPHSDREAAPMKLTANEEYGVRCLVRLAYAGFEGQGLTIPEISQAEGVSTCLCRQDPARAAQGWIRESGARQGGRLYAGARRPMRS